MVVGADGNLYGTTYYGGTNGSGTAFRMTPSGTRTILASFNFSINGQSPNTELARATDGNFYGTTDYGGAYPSYGTLFKLTLAGYVTNLVSFDSLAKGSNPKGGLVQGADGFLYGTASAGGTNGYGTIFKMSLGGAITILRSFNKDTDGGYPLAGLVQANDGYFYGTTTYGGSHNQGTIFKISSNGVFTTLYSFSSTNVSARGKLIQGTDGAFYGVTMYGGKYNQGTIYRFSVSDAPFIINSPKDQVAPTGANAIFSVTADGLSPLYYQWRFNDYNLPGKTNSTLTLNSVSAANSGDYSVRVWNQYGSVVSATAQLAVSQPLVLTPTTQSPTVAQTTPQLWVPTSPTQLKQFSAGNFVPITELAPLDSSRMTIVMTHGWNSDPGEWAKGLAGDILNHLTVPTPNIVAWDWESAASTGPCGLDNAAGKTQEQGRGLGEALLAKLGPNYAQPIHFIGHSLGTLVNAHAADYLHGDASGTPPAKNQFAYSHLNTHLTLFDEAEAATDFSCKNGISALAGRWNPLISVPSYYKPLPSRFLWADNYVSFCGLLKPNARNVVLTNGLPSSASGIGSWLSAAITFHSYPYEWYGDTVLNPGIALMGYRYSHEQGGFAGAPDEGSVFVQTGAGLGLTTADYNATSAKLIERYQKYQKAFATSGAQSIANGLRLGVVLGQSLATGPVNAWSISVSLSTISGAILPSPNSGPRPMSGGDGNIPAYVWIPLGVPSDAISMSFDFSLQGDGKGDSFAAALDGTNVLSIAAELIATNETMNSGPIDIAPYAGKEVELFLGLVGGTSTNATLTVSNLKFYIPEPPSLQARGRGNDLVVTWPLSAQEFSLQSTTNLADINSWTTLTNEPAIVDLENTVTNSISSGARFYRLTK